MCHTKSPIPILGNAQWAWLEKRLPTTGGDPVGLFHTQIIPDKRDDQWGCFPQERQRLFDLIPAAKSNGVLLLSGNVHFTRSPNRNQGIPAHGIHSSGLTHINEA